MSAPKVPANRDSHQAADNQRRSLGSLIRPSVVLSAIVVVLGSGIAYGASAPSPTVYACVTKKGNYINDVDGNTHCPDHTSRITMNVQGPRGAVGATGPRGKQGIQGLQGIQGIPGLKGDQGLPGDKGDKGDPGKDGTDGAPGAKGDKGDPGKDGTNGTDGAPGAKGDKGDPGKDGTNGTDGTDGKDGAAWLTAAGAPSDSDGANGDLYLNTTNGDVYKKTSGTWGTKITNITGPAGAAGSGGSGSVTEQFPNVEVSSSVASSQSLPLLTSSTGSTMPVGTLLTYGAANGGAPSGGNSWDGSVFTVGSEGAGFYELTATTRGSSSSGSSDADSTIAPIIVLAKNDDSGKPFTTGAGWLAQSTSMAGAAFTTTSRNVANLATTVKLDAGDKLRVYGWSGSTAVQVHTVQGQTTIAITRLSGTSPTN